LVAAGIVKSKQEHQLGPFWRSDEVLASLDRFEQRAGGCEAPRPIRTIDQSASDSVRSWANAKYSGDA
jgi:hypothetical protein